MEIELCAKIISSSGLVLDIFGACLVGWEVVDQFKGNKTTTKTTVKKPLNVGRSMDDSPPNPVVQSNTTDSKEFKEWDARKYMRMKIGLGFLVTGFLLQIVGIWIK